LIGEFAQRDAGLAGVTQFPCRRRLVQISATLLQVADRPIKFVNNVWVAATSYEGER
jgi:hypothetical protein